MATPAAVLAVMVKAQGIQTATSQLSALDAAGRKAGGGMDTLQDKAKKSHASLENVGRKAGFVAVGVAGIGGAAVNAAAKYQQSMNTLQAVSGQTGAEMAKTSKLAIKLGADVKLPGTSAQDAAEAMTEMIKAGVSLKDTMAGVRSTLVLSAAAGISNAEAAEIASNALNAFKLKGKDVTMVTDQLANTANASSVEIRDVSDSFKMAAAVFSGFQAPTLGAKGAMTELNVAIGLLGNAGIKGSDAGTSLKQAVLQLTGPSNKAKDAMQALYYAAKGNAGAQGDLTTVLRGGNKDRAAALANIEKMNPALKGGGDIAYTAAGKMRPFLETVRLTALATKHMTDEQKNAYITQIFGADATRSVIAIMNAGPAVIDRMTASVTKTGSAQALANAKMKGFKGSLEAMKSSLETLAINVGTKLLPALTAIVRQFTIVVGALSPTTWTILVGVIGATAAAVWLLNAALTANPITLVIVGLAALAAGLVIAYEKSATFRGIVDATFAALSTAASTVVPAVVGAVGAIGNAFQSMVSFVRSSMNAVVTEVHKWDVAAAVVRTALTVIQALIAPAFAVISGGVRVGMEIIKRVFVTAWAAVKAIFSGAFTVLKGIVVGGAQILHGAVLILGGILKGDFGQIWEGIKKVFTGGITLIKGVLTGSVQALAGAAKAIGDGIKDAFTSALGGAVDLVRGFINDIIKIINKLPFIDIPLISGPTASTGPAGGRAVGNGKAQAALAKGGAFGLTGGMVNAPMVMMGEEAPRYPEYVIPTNPAYRNRAKGLLSQAAGQIGFARGGIVGLAGGGAIEASKHRGEAGLLQKLGTGGLPGWMGGMGKYVLAKAGGFIKDKLLDAAKSIIPGGGGGASLPDGASGNLKAAEALARSMGLSITSTTGGSHVAGSYHYQGRAFDASNGVNTPQEHAFFKAMVAKYGSSITELFFDPEGAIKNGHRIPAIGGHSDHVHVAFRKGGILGGQALANLWVRGGGSAKRAGLMARIALAESGGNPNAKNPSGASGLWQILGQPFKGNVFDPLTNAKMAVWKLKHQGLGAWAASKAVWGKYQDNPGISASSGGGGGSGSNAASGAAGAAAKVNPFDQKVASADLAIVQAQKATGSIKVGSGRGARKISSKLGQISALTAKRQLIGKRIKSIRKALKGHLSSGKRLSLTQELTQRLGEHAELGRNIADLRKLPDPVGAGGDAGGAGGSVGGGDGSDPNQALIDSNAALQAAMEAQAEAAREHAEALKQVRTEIKRQTDFANSVAATSSFQLTKTLADLLSGQIVGYGVAGRAFTPGSGVRASY